MSLKFKKFDYTFSSLSDFHFQVLEYLPVSNSKPDTDDTENEEVLMKNFQTREKYRQVSVVILQAGLHFKESIK